MFLGPRRDAVASAGRRYDRCNTRRANDDVDNDDDGPPPALERVSTTGLRVKGRIYSRRHSRWLVSRECIE